MGMNLRYAFRMLVKDPWFTGVAVLALGLGIGVNSTVFTFVNAVLLRGLPFANADQIVHINSRNTAEGNGLGVSYADYQDWRSQAKSFASLAGYQPITMNISDSGHPPERASGVRVTANAFGIIGERPIRGRDFREGDDRKGAEPVALLGHGLWKTRYGSDPNVIGRSIKINEIPTTVIGVMAEGMKFPNNADLWVTLVPDAEMERRDARRLNLFGRLASGVTLKQAQTELTGIAKALEQQYPDTNKAIDAQVMTFNDRFNGGPIRAVFLALMGAVGFVLLIACANVANLLLSRSARRSREIAVRIALGASRGRVIRQLLVESTLLACLGGVLGLLLSLVGIRLFDMAVADVGKPYWIRFTMDATVFGFLVAVCFATGLIFGIVPALQVSKTNLNEILKEGGRGNAGGRRARWLASSMVVVELALTIVLLAGAGLMIRSFMKMYSMDIGVDATRMLTMRLTLAEKKYPTPEHRRLFYEALLPRLAAIPGVAAASITSAPPASGAGSRALEIEGRPEADPKRVPQVTTLLVSDTYFDTLGVTMRQGRSVRDADGKAGSEAVVVNARFASQFFPGEDVVGKRIKLKPGDRGPDAQQQKPWMTIVGVGPTIRQRNVQDIDPDAVAYLSYRLEPPSGTAILIRSLGDPGSLTSAVREAVQATDPDQPVFGVRTMEQSLAENRWPYRVFGTMFTIFAIIALVLAAVGIYAVTAYSVTQRTQEIGVRMALGAQAGQVSWLILRQGLVQLVIGLALGTAGALAAAPVLRTLLVQIKPSDPVTLVGIGLVFTAVTICACLIPARRATRLDPLAALRVE
jgi:putative ABC transport system permease protein